MSTTDFGPNDPLRSVPAAPAGLPGSDLPGDAAARATLETAAKLTRMANALFLSRPGERAELAAPVELTGGGPVHAHDMAPPSAVTAAPSLSQALAKTTPLAVPLPGEAELRHLLAPRLASGAALPTGMPAASTVAGRPAQAPAGVPYFLQDAPAAAAGKPREASPMSGSRVAALQAVPMASPIPLPGEAELRSLLAPVLTTATAALPASSGAAGTGPATAASAVPGFYFLDGNPATPRGAPALDPAAGVPGASAGAHPPFDVNAVRRDFPILQEQVNGRPLIWLDNGATTQKPQFVIDRLVYFYQHENSNIHRAAHTLAARATDAYEAAREKVRRFMNAPSVDEIVFVRGATEAINLVAQTWGRKNIGADDEILITWLEHHANIVPWQMLAQETGARLKVVPVDDRGQVLLDQYERLLGPRTRLVALTHVSNALGTVTPAARMIGMAKRHGARTLVDGAQAVSHMRTDVQALDCDFYVFSGHKVFAPTGIGVLYGRREILEDMPPWQGGGNMIRDVTFETTQYHEPPGRFEAGTGNIADAVGLGAAIDYVERIGMETISAYEHGLLTYATRKLAVIPGLTMIGTAAEKAAVLSFVLDGIRSEDVGAALSQEGIAVRAGHHCAQPILRRFGLESTVRPSLAFYNTTADIDALAAAVLRIASRGAAIA